MTKKQKFLLFVQTILAARQIKESLALTILEDAMEVTNKELANNISLRKSDAMDFVDWRTSWGNPEPAWLSNETISKILVG